MPSRKPDIESEDPGSDDIGHGSDGEALLEGIFDVLKTRKKMAKLSPAPKKEVKRRRKVRK